MRSAQHILSGMTNISMREILDKVEQRGFAAGRAEGSVRGRAEGRTEGTAKGKSERDTFYGTLMQLPAPLGRIDELIAATSDKSMLASLAKEFGLET